MEEAEEPLLSNSAVSFVDCGGFLILLLGGAWQSVIVYFCLIEWKGKINSWMRALTGVILSLVLQLFLFECALVFLAEGYIPLEVLPSSVMAGSSWLYLRAALRVRVTEPEPRCLWRPKSFQ